MRRLIPILLVAIFCASCSKKTKVTPYEFALLSADVYDDKSISLPDHLQSFLDFEEKKNNIKIDLDFSQIKEIDSGEEFGDFLMETIGNTLGQGGYFGRAYVYPKRKELIIAHRGTDLDREELKNGKSSWKRTLNTLMNTIKDIDDDYAVFKGEIPKQQFEAAENFTQQAIAKYTQQYKHEPKVIHTGHSLGAVLAELCAAKYNRQAITFESPGTKPIIQKLMENKKVNWKKLNITSYNAEPNKINSVHEHVGKVVPLYNAKQTTSDFSEINSRTLDLHSIENILTRFNPENGKPIEF